MSINGLTDEEWAKYRRIAKELAALGDQAIKNAVKLPDGTCLSTVEWWVEREVLDLAGRLDRTLRTANEQILQLKKENDDLRKRLGL